MKTNFYVENHGKKILAKDVENAVKEAWKEAGNKVKDIKEIDLYFNVAENNCYYVINNSDKGCIHIEME